MKDGTLHHLTTIKTNWNCNTTAAVDRNLKRYYFLPPTVDEGEEGWEGGGGGLLKHKEAYNLIIWYSIHLTLSVTNPSHTKCTRPLREWNIFLSSISGFITVNGEAWERSCYREPEVNFWLSSHVQILHFICNASATLQWLHLSLALSHLIAVCKFNEQNWLHLIKRRLKFKKKP